MLPQLLSIFGASTSSTSFGAIGLGLLIGFSLLFLIGYTLFAFYLYCAIEIFEKANKPGWAAIIPIYSTWTLFEIGGKPGWFALIMIAFFIPFTPLILIAAVVYLVLLLLVDLELAKRFGKGTGFAIVLFLFPWIGAPILALGKSEYHADGSAPSSPQGGSTSPQPIATSSPSVEAPTVQPSPGVLPPPSSTSPETQPPTPPQPPLPPSPIQ